MTREEAGYYRCSISISHTFGHRLQTSGVGLRMLVGVNYPWLDYGWDFGLGPPAWRGSLSAPRWYGEIDLHLRHLHDLGVSVVRWFVLADGLTYGTGRSAPKPDTRRKGEWRFEPPAIGSGIVEHFAELLHRFAIFNASVTRPILLLPVLIDFHFCERGVLRVLKPDPSDPTKMIQDPDWVKQGRADAITKAGKRRRFLDNALEPLLRASQQHGNTIFSWELINEPEWITNGWHPDRRRDHPVGERAMRAFLDEGIERVRQAGFKPTIGFALIETLRKSGITADLNQFHHYPGGGRRLPPNRFDPQFPAIIGEFATATTDLWPDLLVEEQRVLERLNLCARQGYPLAMPWSFLTRDRHTDWTRNVEQDLRTFKNQQDDAPLDRS